MLAPASLPGTPARAAPSSTPAVRVTTAADFLSTAVPQNGGNGVTGDNVECAINSGTVAAGNHRGANVRVAWPA